MPAPHPRTEHKSAHQLLFNHYLRTGQRLHGDAALRFVEQKFNPYHDPDDGRFTFGPGGGSLAPRTFAARPLQLAALRNLPLPGNTSAKPKPKPTATPTPWANTHPGERLPVWRARDPATERGLPVDWRYRAGKGDQIGREEVERRADNAQNQFYYNWGRGMSIEEAAAWAANSEDESRSDHRANQDGGGPGRGLFQWEKRGRAREFEKRFKIPIEESTRDQQHSFREWELANPENSAKLRIDAAQGAGAKAAAISVHYLRPADESGAATDRANIAEAIIRRVRQSR